MQINIFNQNRKRLILATTIAIMLFVFYPLGNIEPIKYIDRDTGTILTEKVPGEFWLSWLYYNPLGRASLNVLVKKKALSEWYGKKMDSSESAKKIDAFVQEYNIDLSIAQKQKFSSFNDFFYRKLKPDSRPVNKDSLVLISPADGKVFVLQNIDTSSFIIKSHKFNLQSFLSNDSLYSEYKSGVMLVVRLCPADYHRFHFPASGRVLREYLVNGDYYSVSPIALRKKVEIFCMNKREITELETKSFGNIIISEVGATMVGSIIQTYTGDTVIKGEEKGYFKFGGSTVVLVLKSGIIKIDNDIVNNSLKGFETTVKFGERIGVHL